MVLGEFVVPATQDLEAERALMLEGADKVAVRAVFERWDIKRFKVGERVFVKADGYGLQAADKSVLRFGRVLAKPKAKKRPPEPRPPPARRAAAELPLARRGKLG